MIYLMNSAICPTPGTYRFRLISRAEFARRLVAAYDAGALESRIGYPDTARFIERVVKAETGRSVSIPVSREPAEATPGDEMLVVRVRYRVRDPRQKGRFTPRDDDFEFGVVEVLP